MRLTDIGVNALPIPSQGQKTYRDDALPGFCVRISHGGTKTFTLIVGKNRQFITLGRYPVISLAEARGKAKHILASRTLGHLMPETIAFKDALTEYLALKERANKASSYASTKRRLQVHFLPAFKELKVAASPRSPSTKSAASLVGLCTICVERCERRWLH
ncbi:MAG TPA: Arm DNA-binding domain-containing protein [Stellaceae bacterium]